MVAKAIVVRNLFSYEYDGSNPSLPTKNKFSLFFLFCLVQTFVYRGVVYEFYGSLSIVGVKIL